MFAGCFVLKCLRKFQDQCQGLDLNHLHGQQVQASGLLPEMSCAPSRVSICQRNMWFAGLQENSWSLIMQGFCCLAQGVVTYAISEFQWTLISFERILE
ncbi:hypothetical protein CEXT_447351 [Caerostris extrusa]|uniref:Uncharacterized protein n=1 Tax=Caerostris extrusa TaxID=172846 RepID=A0AAV4TBP0_CAEEX|nr:hypothetical protein CEXT_447351 [Caerostris extrusa]